MNKLHDMQELVQAGPGGIEALVRQLVDDNPPASAPSAAALHHMTSGEVILKPPSCISSRVLLNNNWRGHPGQDKHWHILPML